MRDFANSGRTVCWLAVLLLLAVGLGAQTPAPAAKAAAAAGQGDGDFDFDFGDSAGKSIGDPRHVSAAPFGDRLDVTSPWLFEPGAEPGVDPAAPAFEDSGWKRIDPHALFSHGLRGLNEVWYRVHVHLPPGTHALGLTVAEFGGSYRVYVNGAEIGGHGVMGGKGDFLLARSATFAIPDSVLAPDTVIAIHAFVGRVDRATFTLDDGLSRKSAVYLGPANVLYRDQQTYFMRGLSENISTLTLWAVLLALSLGLTFLIPRTPVYPLLAVFAGCHLSGVLLGDWASFHYYPSTHGLALAAMLLTLVSDLALLEFLRVLAERRRNKWLLGFAALYLVAVMSLGLAAGGVVSFAFYASLLRLTHVLFRVVLITLSIIAARRRQQDAYVLMSVLGLYCVSYGVWWLLGHVVFFWAPLNQLAEAFTANIKPDLLADQMFVIAFLGVVLVRTLRIVRERAAIANEIEAARTMQQLLLAQSNQSTPGFQVESVYLPAGEVGGDFFVVSPCTDGSDGPSLTVIVGDVSGKGLRAAMRVSMILGVLRREPSREPAAMLLGLNQALADEGDTGFTTACCVRLSADGRYTVANAGHIAPYVSGVEVVTAPALPLGLAPLEPGETYPVVSGRLLPGQRLVLMSDGVAEARTHKGELYGFERLAPLTLKPAQEIAATAQKFGQDDDITVLTLACLPRSTNQPPPPPPGARFIAASPV